MTIETDAQELAELASRHPEIAGVLESIVAVGRTLDVRSTGIAGIVAAHQAPVVIHRATPEEEEWIRQTNKFIDLRFNEALLIADPEQYRKTIPHFPPQLRSPDGVYDRFLAVEPRIVLPQLHNLMGIAEFIDTLGITNTIRIPKKPYIVCLQSGPVELFEGTFDQAMAKIPRNGIATPLIEVDFAYLRYPELPQSWIDAGSSRDGADDVPYLLVRGGRPRVRAGWVVFSDGGWRLLSRGKKIGT